MKFSNIRFKLTVGFILLVAAVLHIASWTVGHNWGGDFAGYIAQAQSIVASELEEFVGRNTFTIESATVTIGPITYPWGYALLLSPAVSLVGFDSGLAVWALKFVGLTCFIGFLIVLWKGFAEYLKPSERLFLVAVFALNPYFVWFSDNVLSDVPFLLFSSLGVLYAERLLHNISNSRSLLQLAGLGALIAIATTIRTNGLLLLIAYLGVVLLAFVVGRYGKADAVNGETDEAYYRPRLLSSVVKDAVVPLVTFLILLILWGASLPERSGSHFAHLTGVSVASVVDNLAYYSVLLKHFFGSSVIGLVIYLLTVPFALVGLFFSWRQMPVFVLYSALTIVLYVVWPYQQGLRFLFPVLPLYVYCMIVGYQRIVPALVRREWFIRVPAVLLLMAFAAGSTILVKRNIDRGFQLPDGPYAAQAQEMFAYLTQHVASDEVVIFFKPRVLGVLTGLSATSYDHAGEFKPRDWYVVAKGFEMLGKDQHRILLDRHTAEVVFENDKFSVYRLE